MCEYFSLYDSEEEGLTNWGKALANDFSGQEWNIKFIPELKEKGVLDREGIEEETLTRNRKKALWRAEKIREKCNIPSACPHDPVDGEQYCKFHLSVEKCEEHGITKEEVCESVYRKVTEETGEESRCFAGGKFRELSFPYKTLKSNSNRPLQFQYSNISNLNLNNSMVDKEVRFDGSNIKSMSCEKTRFRRHISIERSDIGREDEGVSISFNESVLEDGISLKNSNISARKIHFIDCSARNDISFENTNISLRLTGKPNNNLNPIQFKDTNIEGDFNFKNLTLNLEKKKDARKKINIRFNQCRFSGDANFKDCEFPGEGGSENAFQLENKYESNDKVKLNNDIEWNIYFNECPFESEAKFEGSEMGGGVDLSGSRFESEANFTDSTMKGDVDFSESRFEEGAKFKDITIHGDVNLSLVEFSGSQVSFEGSTIYGGLDLRNAKLRATKSNFTGMDIRGEGEGEFNASNTVFDSNTTKFDDVDISCTVIDFEASEMTGELSFEESELRADEISFLRVSAEFAELIFKNVKTNGGKVNFEEANLTEGKFEIGGCDTVYDFTNATIGNISISSRDRELFEYFVFIDTEFDGFDFNQKGILRELKRTDWRIHTTHRADERTAGRVNRYISRLKRYYNLIINGPNNEVDPNSLESTYRKAKLGASQKGHPKAVSEFFQKELQYRRRTHGHRFWDRSAEYNRVKTAWEWLANATLGATVGYGERPSKVVLTSVATVLLFAFIYIGLSALPPDSGFLSYLTYSFQGFIQLVVGISPKGELPVRLVTAFEGFLGAFIIALFVITLTRSIDR